MQLDHAVVLLCRDEPGNSRELMSHAAEQAMGLLPGDVILQRLCRHCGSSEHGQPSATGRATPADSCCVSFSSAAGYAVAAASRDAGIGVDIESASKVSSHRVDDVLLHPAERLTFDGLGATAGRRYLSQLWVAKEAIVKSTGDGLRIDLRQLLVTLDGMTGELQSWPTTIELQASPRLRLFDLSGDVVGALAVNR